MTLKELVYIALLVMFVLPGLLAIGVGVRGSRWVFDSPSYRFIVRRLGMGWARLLFVLLGILLLGAALLVLWDPMGVMEKAIK